MDRTSSANLLAVHFSADEVQQPQDINDADLGPHGVEINPRHRGWLLEHLLGPGCQEVKGISAVDQRALLMTWLVSGFSR